MPSNPTPAVPMDGMEPRAHFNLMAHYMAVADSPEGYEAIRDDLWGWVVAYGDRRAEEVRGEAQEMRSQAQSEYVGALHRGTDSKLRGSAALSSPAPEGVERGE